MGEIILTGLHVSTDSQNQTVVRFPPGVWEQLNADISAICAENAKIRETTLREIWYALKAALPVGEPQRILNQVIDAARAKNENKPQTDRQV